MKISTTVLLVALSFYVGWFACKKIDRDKVDQSNSVLYCPGDVEGMRLRYVGIDGIESCPK